MNKIEFTLRKKCGIYYIINVKKSKNKIYFSNIFYSIKKPF